MAEQFFAIKTRDSVAVRKILAKESGIELGGINVLKEEMRMGTLLFIVLGGDRPAWDTGLIGIGEVSEEPYDIGYDKRNYKLKIDMKAVMETPIKREALIPYKDCYGIIAIGPQLKGEPNQALTTMTRKQGIALMRAMAELCPSVVEDIRKLAGEDFNNEIFGSIIKMVEIPFNYKEDEKSAIERLISSKEKLQPKSTLEQYKKFDLKQRKQSFIDWMKTLIKPNGKPYSEKVINDYAYILEKAASNLDPFPFEEINFFQFTDDISFTKAENAAKDASNFQIINNKYANNGLTATFAKYHEFLQFLDDGIEGGDEEKAITVDTGIKSCLEVQRFPRAVKMHPLNFIIYGAPGTGKTYSTAEYALAIIENRAADLQKKTVTERKAVMKKYNGYVRNGQIVFTTFHQSYGYEEFIQGLRPDTDVEGMSFKTVDGIFKKISDTALNDPVNNYVIIVDEINRANISKVFGELITLIEEDKRWGEINETCATLQSGGVFAVPNNLYIVGTMNSADKSISLIDAALRRRFSFIEQQPDDSLVEDSVLRKVLHEMNTLLAKELDSTDLLVGHSYFMSRSADDICSIFNNSIIPLLYEYFYDNRKKVGNILNDVIKKSGAAVEVEDNIIGRLRVTAKGEANDSEQV